MTKKTATSTSGDATQGEPTEPSKPAEPLKSISLQCADEDALKVLKVRKEISGTLKLVRGKVVFVPLETIPRVVSPETTGPEPSAAAA